MIGIKAIAYAIPDCAIDNVEQARTFGKPESFVREKIGATRLPRLSSRQETSDLAVASIHNLVRLTGLTLNTIEALVVITQHGDSHGSPHTSAIVQHKAGLATNIAAFDIGLACSGYVYGLAITKGLMETAGFRNALLVTADPYSKVVNPSDINTALLIGDAATATWIGENCLWTFAPPFFSTDGSGSGYVGEVDGKLSMNGRQVFEFASTKVPVQIQQCLDREGLRMQDIDLYCVHQGSAAIVSAVARHFKEVSSRFVCDLDQTGNTASSSIPLILAPRILDSAVSTILISGFGAGLSWATTILKRSA